MTIPRERTNTIEHWRRADTLKDQLKTKRLELFESQRQKYQDLTEQLERRTNEYKESINREWNERLKELRKTLNEVRDQNLTLKALNQELATKTHKDLSLTPFLVVMAPPKQAWRTTPANRNFTSSSSNVRGFAKIPSPPPPLKRRSSGYKMGVRVGEKYGKLKNLAGKNKLALGASAALLAPALGGLLGALLGKKKKKKQSGGTKTKNWRVETHRDFLQRLPNDWENELTRASNDELRAVTDIVRNIFDATVALPRELSYPLQGHKKEVSHISALTTPLHRRRSLLIDIPSLREWIRFFTVSHGL